MTLIGTGILWFGWFGFNGGSAGASNGLAGSAFMVTHIAAATAGLVWCLIE
jgi:Amt family ammonium transporter